MTSFNFKAGSTRNETWCTRVKLRRTHSRVDSSFLRRVRSPCRTFANTNGIKNISSPFYLWPGFLSREYVPARPAVSLNSKSKRVTEVERLSKSRAVVATYGARRMVAVLFKSKVSREREEELFLQYRKLIVHFCIENNLNALACVIE